MSVGQGAVTALRERGVARGAVVSFPGGAQDVVGVGAGVAMDMMGCRVVRGAAVRFVAVTDRKSVV